VLVRNVQIAQATQRDGKSADTSDAKWVLARLGKDRGYVERNEITGKNGEALLKGYVGISPDDWNGDADKDA
jgi:hypothetical protein